MRKVEGVDDADDNYTRVRGLRPDSDDADDHDDEEEFPEGQRSLSQVMECWTQVDKVPGADLNTQVRNIYLWVFWLRL